MMQLLSSKHERRAMRGWERLPAKLYLTLNRQDKGETQAWGFSMIGGSDMQENSAFWSGIVAARHQKGLWLQVGSVRRESPADQAQLKERDFVIRINGRIVFHMEPKE